MVVYLTRITHLSDRILLSYTSLSPQLPAPSQPSPRLAASRGGWDGLQRAVSPCAAAGRAPAVPPGCADASDPGCPRCSCAVRQGPAIPAPTLCHAERCTTLQPADTKGAFLATVMQKEILPAHPPALWLHVSLESPGAVLPASVLCNSRSWPLQPPLSHLSVL